MNLWLKRRPAPPAELVIPAAALATMGEQMAGLAAGLRARLDVPHPAIDAALADAFRVWLRDVDRFVDTVRRVCKENRR